jgi:hypothetical protein
MPLISPSASKVRSRTASKHLGGDSIMWPSDQPLLTSNYLRMCIFPLGLLYSACSAVLQACLLACFRVYTDCTRIMLLMEACA